MRGFPAPARLSAPVFATVLAGSALLTTGCSSSSTAASAASSMPMSSSSSTPMSSSATDTIVIKNFMFEPMSLTVSPGTKITVTNDDTVAHTLSATGNKAFDTGNIGAGKTVTFTAPSSDGTYAYICDIHQYMQGTLIVK